MPKTRDALSVEQGSQRKGLQVRRRFTTEGTHPYDQLTWEHRDAVISNWRDGSIAFEQRDVEFPASWSLNATNIVAQKYFRGPLGTPKRERSVRQMIDRVAGTITGWGVKDGYFASDTDGEVFQAELSHILVNQMAAFNSPVWFNVGVEPEPQASACFILSVQDTMPSILNWYVEEGMIFKGGSGSGVNLSSIRSSKEQLANGGEASGPVSFMRGADSSAGTIKSGGKTRRAAKMVILNVDHPDVRDFIWCKAREEHKARVLRDAGFDMDLDGRDSISIQYQNANNSVRVTDEFMRSWEDDESYDLRAVTDGHTVETVPARDVMRDIAQAAWECADPGMQYDTTINDWHTTPESGRINASNPCSEYMHLDNSACNLASLNLLKFLKDDGKFDVEAYKHAVEIVFLAQEIIVGNSSYPTERITANAKAFRQLGLGYANLGALLMALGKGYDSDGGRAWAGALTALMTGHAYRTSARVAQVVGPFDGYGPNRKPMLRVMRKHRGAVEGIQSELVQTDLLDAARTSWDDAIKFGEEHGYRNAQASVLAPTGCLVPGTLVTTDRGLVRLGQLGDPHGARWQELDVTVATDEGPRPATKFFVNGHEQTRRIETSSGYLIQGTEKHQVKVIDESTGAWIWRRLADVRPGDMLPLQLGGLVGPPRTVELPTLGEMYWTGERQLRAPTRVTAELAEFVGYFMGDGSLHAKGLRLCVADTDLDVVEHLSILGKSLFGLEAHVTQCTGYRDVAFHSVRLAKWWEACGFAKGLPESGVGGKGWEPHVPAALLESNDPEIYGAFVRGLFEADGSVSTSTPSLATASAQLATDVSTILLVLGIPTTTRRTVSGWGRKTMSQLRVRNLEYVPRFNDLVGFISERKARACAGVTSVQSGNRDRIVLPGDIWSVLAPLGHPRRNAIQLSLRKHGAVSRTLARQLFEETADPRLGHALGYIFERVASNEDGGVQPTYDLSVPSNVTYVANGFVSHNTISFLMDCDTTGIEPDLALIKYKKLVGGGSMAIVNQTVPRALRTLGYADEHVQAVVEYVAEHNSVKGAPALREEHYEVFDCAMGDSPIHYMGHLRMMAAVQPFISGAISKTANLPESATVEDVEQVYVEGWKLGLKAVAIYRDNCKVGQPLSVDKKGKDTVHTDTGVDIEIDKAPVRKRLPKARPSTTTSFRIGDLEGYVTAGSYPDDGLGELFVKVSKQGSTLSGVMDAFAIAVSLGLQYGVPLEAYVSKFTNMIFEPNGLTDDADIRFAQSIVDYLFRRLAIDHLDDETRHALGIKTTAERSAALNEPAVAEVTAQATPATEASGPAAPVELAPAESRPAPTTRAGGLALTPGMSAVDAPYCSTCGVRMRPAGSCFACESCGTTSGCS
jgi:ribonucleoside-diphosphate reductase alpha chain